MAYHEPLADRTREALAFNPALGEKDVEEKKMMGGLAFMVWPTASITSLKLTRSLAKSGLLWMLLLNDLPIKNTSK
jgi:hypothetical protein